MNTTYHLLTCIIGLAVAGAGLAQPIPHGFRGITVASGGNVTLSLGGSAKDMFNLTGTISNQFAQGFDLYPMDTTTDLVNWTRLAVLLRTNADPNPLLFTDTRSGGSSHHLYRTATNHLLTFFPKPTGRFAVGFIDRVMMDPARTNLYRYSPRTNAFMVSFWYPSEPHGAGALPAPMWDKRVAADISFYSNMGMDRRWGQIFSVAVSHRVAGVPLAAGSAGYPVILYSNGLGGHRKALSQQFEELASHGYVVVAVDHGDCWATEFPDGRYLSGNHDGDVSGRLKDMTFLLDELARLDRNDPLFAGRLDLEHIGGYGQSYGGTVVETCRTDARMSCAAIWDATNIQSLSNAGLRKPLLVALGQDSWFLDEDLWLFNKATNSAVFFQVKGASHASIWDAAWTANSPKGQAHARAVTACLLWFYDKYLKGLDSPFPANPEIYNLKTK